MADDKQPDPEMSYTVTPEGMLPEDLMSQLPPDMQPGAQKIDPMSHPGVQAIDQPEEGIAQRAPETTISGKKPLDAMQGGGGGDDLGERVDALKDAIVPVMEKVATAMDAMTEKLDELLNME